MAIAEPLDTFGDRTGASSHRTRRVATRPKKERTGLLHPAAPFYMIAFMPLFWLMGLAFFTFAIAAVPMGIALLSMKPIRMPKGYGLWLLFIGWMVASFVTLEPTLTRYLAFALRAGIYIGSTIVFLYIYNIPQKYLPTGRVLGMIAGIFVFTAIIGGYLGLIFGDATIPTLFSQILPRSLLSNGFVRNIVQPPFAQTQNFLGFPLNRPAFPFSFSNDWAATLAPAMFAAVAAAGRARRFRKWLPVLAFLALIPMVLSVNRGLWVVLIGSVIYVAVRRASTGNLLLAGRLLAATFIVGGLVLVSPIGSIVTDRATTTHSTGARNDINAAVIERIPESPLLGFGAPVANPDPNRPAIGTHGNFWTALFSQGIPGAVFYTGFWVTMSVKTGRRIRNQEQLLLHLAVLSALPTMFFYDHLPAALPIMMMCLAVFFRDQRDDNMRREALLASGGVPSALI